MFWLTQLVQPSVVYGFVILIPTNVFQVRGLTGDERTVQLQKQLSKPSAPAPSPVYFELDKYKVRMTEEIS